MCDISSLFTAKKHKMLRSAEGAKCLFQNLHSDDTELKWLLLLKNDGNIVTDTSRL